MFRLKDLQVKKYTHSWPFSMSKSACPADTTSDSWDRTVSVRFECCTEHCH